MNKIDEIKQRLADVPKRWQWEHSYELHDGKHWTLVDPDHRTNEHGDDVVVSGDMVLATSETFDFDGKMPLVERPVLAFIGSAPEDMRWLIDQLEAIQKERDKYYAQAAYWQYYAE